MDEGLGIADEADKDHSAVKRGRLCAVCHVPVTGIAAFKMRWCIEDNYYVCGRCWLDSCLHRHESRTRNNSWNLFWGVFLISLIILPVSIGPLYEYETVKSWNEMSPIKIVDVAGSSIVKIKGVINNDTGFKPVKGTLENWSWPMDRDSNFIVRDDTGTIRVYTSQMYGFYDLPYSYDSTRYKQNRSVVVIGSVKHTGNETALDLIYLTTAAKPISVDMSDSSRTFIFLPLMILMVIFSIAIIAKRGRDHSKAVKYATAAMVPKELLEPDPSIRWVANTPPPLLKYRRILLLLLIAIWGMGVVVILTAHLDRYPSFTNTSLFMMILNAFCLCIPGIIILEIREPPSHIGFDRRGIHLWYPSLSARLIQTTFISDKDLVPSKDLANRLGIGWYLSYDLEKELHPGLSAANRELFKTEMNARKSPSDSETTFLEIE